jgi:hypothetical protein
MLILQGIVEGKSQQKLFPRITFGILLALSRAQKAETGAPGFFGDDDSLSLRVVVGTLSEKAEFCQGV